VGEVDEGDCRRPRSSSSLPPRNIRLDGGGSGAEEAVHLQAMFRGADDKDVKVFLPPDDEDQDTDTPVAASDALTHTLPQPSIYSIAKIVLESQRLAAQSESLESTPSATTQYVSACALNQGTEWGTNGLFDWESVDAKALRDDLTLVIHSEAPGTGTSPRAIGSDEAVRGQAPKRLWTNSILCNASQCAPPEGTEVNAPHQLPIQGSRVWKGVVSEVPCAVPSATTEVDQYESLTSTSLAKTKGSETATGSQVRKRLWVSARRLSASQPAAGSRTDIKVRGLQESVGRPERQPESDTEAALKALGF